MGNRATQHCPGCWCCQRCREIAGHSGNFSWPQGLALKEYSRVSIRPVLDTATNPTPPTARKRPGPKSRHSGMFPKGSDARRPQGQKLIDGVTLAQMARKRTPECFALLDRAISDEAVPWPVRIRAVELIKEWGHGRSVSIIEMNVTHSRDITTLSREELRAIAAGQAPRTPITYEGEASKPLATAGHTADSHTEF